MTEPNAAGRALLSVFDRVNVINLEHRTDRRDEMAAQLTRPLGHPEGGPMHVDGAYSWFRAARPDVVTLVPEAPIAAQRPSRSDIHGSKWFDRIAAFRPVVASLRRMKAEMRAG